MVERRKHDRSRGFTIGTIACGRPDIALDCVLGNLSEGGAFLLVDEPRHAPVDLQIALSGETWPARVVWRSETGIGVAFVAAPTAPIPQGRSAEVVYLDAVRRQRVAGSDERRLAERIARFVRPFRPPDGD